MRFFDKLSAWSRNFYAGLKTRIKSFFRRWHALPPNDIQYTFSPHRYPGSRMRRYRVHVPPKAESRGPLPLVMVLHGCKQDNEDIEQISGFNEVADKHGFIVVYPFVTSYRGMRIINCWGWWFDREIHRGAGEVEDLWQIIEEIGANHNIDRNRIHVTGLSSGAAMTVAMLVAHADRIASGAAVAGLAYSERPEAVRHLFNRRPRNRPLNSIVAAMQKELDGHKRLAPLKIVHSHNDQTVDIQSAHNLRDSWARCFDINLKIGKQSKQGKTAGTEWELNSYRNGSDKSTLQTLFLSGPGHGWYGGKPGDFSFTEAPDISRQIWKFFEKHPLSD